jgi:hypothetical protein
MATTSRNGGGDKAAATDIAISAAVVVSTLREESERLQCLAAAQMAIRESCAERLQTCPELRDDVRIADARKGAYEAAALRLQGIVEAVLRRGGAGAAAETAGTATTTTVASSSPSPSPRHPLIVAALSLLQSPRKRYEALVQLAYTKENVPVDGETMTALRQAYRDVCELLPGVADVGEVEALRGMPELLTWMSAASSKIPDDAAFQTQALLAAIDSKAWPQSSQAIVEAAVTEIRRLGNDAAVRVMLGLV